MTGLPVKREAIDASVQRLVAAHVTGGIPCGLAEIPDLPMEGPADKRVPTKRFVIVFPMPTGESLGGPVLPESTVTLGYVIRSHGRDRRQAQWVADEVRRVVIGRNDIGGVLYALDLSDQDGAIEHGEHDRYHEGPYGAVTFIEHVWQGSDEFYVTVSRIESEDA